ncbi:MAG: DEAD/DEAH box helicase [Anaerovorax sp.]|nr:DEAD/DEAH box helicase [Anaerovorax sp.]
MNVTEKLSQSLTNGFIDCNLSSLERYNPKLLVNDHKRGMKVLTSVEAELRHCEEFYFSVAFITNSGVASLISIFTELENKGIKGKILTSQYQNFTEPRALKRLLKLSNVQLRIVTEGNFHAKGYIFRRQDSFSFIIGSSNLTQNALGENKEWNLKLSSLEQGAVMQNILKEFHHSFDQATVIDERWLSAYEKIYEGARKIRRKMGESERENNLISLSQIYPNKMQKDALQALGILRRDGKKKALLISATGTGKTYLSAFDVADFQPKKFLFVVHRENIARAAMKSYKNILGEGLKAGILSGAEKNFDADYIFSTVQTLSKDLVLHSFTPTHFDYIVIDEVHRSGAATYQKILNYFNPQFLLGMSATPERTDGFDIFKTFDYNVAYEIRLHRALEEKMLSPFHYYGVSEIRVEGQILDEYTSFQNLVCKERVNRILEAANYYGWDNGRVKGLIFCSGIDEAKELSNAFNKRGYYTISLDGSSSETTREEAIKRLEQEKMEGRLDYIFTVDIFNEGVDIPSVNQIIMLRPTQSAIVFVQQLGRGLRKTADKEYLTVIDFIGNYANNYLVPIALYGDRSYNKDTVRKLINSGSSLVPGSSTINFDEIIKERIFSSIDVSNLSTLKELRKEYELMKYQLGKRPMMVDFLFHGRREPYAFIHNARSFYNFQRKVEMTHFPVLSDKAIKQLEFYSMEILNGKRVEETVMLALLIGKHTIALQEVADVVEKRFNYIPSQETLQSAVHHLNGKFLKDLDQKKYQVSEHISIIHENGTTICRFSEEANAFFSDECFAMYVDDMIHYSFERFRLDYKQENYREGFLLYEKYSRKDVCRILNWEKNEESTIYGYRIKYNTCPIFVTYHKENDISESTKYEDTFINPYYFSWMTRNRVTLKSTEVKAIQEHEKSGLRISLFIKKSDGEGSDFYYMGDLKPQEFIETEISNDKGSILPIVNIKFRMMDEVEDSMYQYFKS